MDQANVWRLPATLFLVGMLAMLLAGAWRELEMPIRPAAAITLPSPEDQPRMGEPPSNEIADFPQLD
jgi:hypothetical protein